jgi:Tol biopolymer transport system component
VTLTPGTRCGAFEILALIGEGGMGRVYRARDTKLKRDVALKTLPDEFSADPDRLARFQREAEALAALSHPHIAGIHELAEAGGSHVLVLELVEGETLADRLRGGPLPIDEALTIAKQIAEALAAAHERGIVHRDLKPSNIKIGADGRVKVLDFGLAKMLEPGGAGWNPSQSPTVLTTTGLGVILGTAAYMSPEQAKGKPIDRTADVWAFGCVLFEMLGGRQAFNGDSVTEILSEVLTRDPAWDRLPPSTPAGVRRLLTRCLQKNPSNRLHDMTDARIEIEDAQRGTDGEDVDRSRARGPRDRSGWIAAGACLLTALGAIAFALRPAPLPPEMHVEIGVPSASGSISLAISPDGQKLVFAGTQSGRSKLWLRPLGANAAIPMAGTDGATLPFWSPDSGHVGFFADGKLKRIDIAGGSPQSLADVTLTVGGAWGRDGTILFAPRLGLLQRVAASGGPVSYATRASADMAANQRYPHFLPDGDHFLFLSVTPDKQAVCIGSLRTADWTPLLDADSTAVLTASGHLLFIRNDTLFAQAFDANRRELRGDAVPVVDGIWPGFGYAPVSASAAGPWIYRRGSAAGRRQLAWVDRSGTKLATVGEPDDTGIAIPELSRDGRRIAVERRVNGNRDVWVVDSVRGAFSRFTLEASDESSPVWSADGKWVIFAAVRRTTFDLYRKPSTGVGREEPLLESSHVKVPLDISPDGRTLLYRVTQPGTGHDLWALPLEGPPAPFPVVVTPFAENEGQFSPDGKWIAFRSNESGRFEVYVQPFPGPGQRLLVSHGGAQPRWSPDGRELFYVALDGRLMAVPLTRDRDGNLLEAGAPAALFAANIPDGAIQGIFKQQYVVSPDGQRFLINQVAEESAAAPAMLILNWRPPGSK